MISKKNWREISCVKILVDEIVFEVSACISRSLLVEGGPGDIRLGEAYLLCFGVGFWAP